MKVKNRIWGERDCVSCRKLKSTKNLTRHEKTCGKVSDYKSSTISENFDFSSTHYCAHFFGEDKVNEDKNGEDISSFND